MPARRRKRRSGDETALELPVLTIHDTVLFPHVVTPLLVGRDRSIRAVEEAMAGDRTIIVVAQRDPQVDDLTAEDLYPMGTEALIARVLKMPDGMTSVFVQGQRRVHLTTLTQRDPCFKFLATPVIEPAGIDIAVEALMRAVLALFEKCVKLSADLSEDAYVAAMNVEEPGWLADLIASQMGFSVAQRQEILEIIDPVARLQRINVLLARELDVLELQNKIHSQVQQEVEKSQREYFLREQLRAIQKELSVVDPQARDIENLRNKVAKAGMPERVVNIANEELERLSLMPTVSPEISVIRTYLDWLISLPWVETTEDCLDIRLAAKVLEANHYGLRKVKERILEYMAVRKLAGDRLRSPILCFVGPPGVGKTSLGRSIALALGRKFVRR
jgi:ATP-dependent Lon protease